MKSYPSARHNKLPLFVESRVKVQRHIHDPETHAEYEDHPKQAIPPHRPGSHPLHSHAIITGSVKASTRINAKPSASQSSLKVLAGRMGFMPRSSRTAGKRSLEPRFLIIFLFVFRAATAATDTLSTRCVDSSIHLPCKRTSCPSCFTPHDTT